MRPLLILFWLFPSALPARAAGAAVASQGVLAEAEEEKPDPRLVMLDRALTEKLELKRNGKITPEVFKEFSIQFRTDLEKTWDKSPKTPADIGLHARIVANLEEPVQALASLDDALAQNPDSPILQKARGQIQLQQGDYPAALASANRVLRYNQEKGQPADTEALAIKYSAIGRVAGEGTSTVQAERKRVSRSVVGQTDDRPAVLAIKGGRATPSEVPMAAASVPGEPKPKQRHSPVLPILLLTGASFTAFGGYRVLKSKGTQTATEGLNPAPSLAPDQARRNYINSAILLGTPALAIGAVLGGPIAWRAVVPVATALWQQAQGSVQRVATSQAGAVFPNDQIAAQRLSVARAALTTTSNSNLPGRFFEGARYTPNVLSRMQGSDYHSFPEIVKNYASTGQVSTIKGGDGIVRQMLRIPGSYQGRKGVFEFIKEVDGSINHRFFRPL